MAAITKAASVLLASFCKAPEAAIIRLADLRSSRSRRLPKTHAEHKIIASDRRDQNRHFLGFLALDLCALQFLAPDPSSRSSMNPRSTFDPSETLDGGPGAT